MEKITATLTLSVLLLLSSCGGDDGKNGKKEAPPPPRIEGYIVRPQPLSEQIQVNGRLLPAERVDLVPEVAGKIISLNLPEGQRVQKGALLVKLYDADLKAQLQKQQVQLKTAESTESRLKQLLGVKGVSQEEYDQAAAQVEMLKAEIANTEALINKTEIRAPFDGTVGLRSVSPGAYVSPGMVLATIRDDQQLKIDFSVPEALASYVSKGMNVSFTFKDDTTNYSATVIATEQGIDENALSQQVRALVSGRSARLVPGASVTVNVGLSAGTEALMVPTQSVIPQARYKTVLVARGGKAESVKITTGIRTAASLQVTSGLQAGDTVITTGIQFIRPGAVLKFTSVK